MDNSLIAKAMSSFSAPPISSGAVTDSVGPSSEEDSEEDVGMGMGKKKTLVSLFHYPPISNQNVT